MGAAGPSQQPVPAAYLNRDTTNPGYQVRRVARRAQAGSM